MENQGVWQLDLGNARSWKHQYQQLFLAATIEHSLGICINKGKHYSIWRYVNHTAESTK